MGRRGRPARAGAGAVEEAARAASPPPAAPPPAQLLDVRLSPAGAIEIGPAAAPLLDGLLPASAWAADTAPGGMLVLGAAAAPGGASASVDVTLGALRARRWLACARNKLWWMTPEWGTSARELPPETQFLLAELEGGAGYAALLPLIDGGSFRGTLRGPRCALV